MASKRDYKQERKTAIARGETGVGSKSGDAVRHRARRKMEKHLGHKLSPGQTIEHGRKIKDGGSNSTSNLSIMSLSKNTSGGGKAGNRAGKSRGGKIGGKSKGALHTASK